MFWSTAFRRRRRRSMRPTRPISQLIKSQQRPGIAAGAQAAAACIQGRVNDGAYPVPAPAFLGNTAPGQWRPTGFTPTGEPVPLGVAWMATTKPFTVTHASQFFAPGPPRLTSSRYTRDYNEVKEFGSNVGSARTPEQTAIAMFHSGNTLVLWNQTLRSLADRYVTNVGDSARLFALVNVAMADAAMSAWQAKIQYNSGVRAQPFSWETPTAIAIRSAIRRGCRCSPTPPTPTTPRGRTSGRLRQRNVEAVLPDRSGELLDGGPYQQPLLHAIFRRLQGSGRSAHAHGHSFPVRRYDGANEGQRVARWAYKYFLRSLEGDEFDFIRTLDTTEDIDLMEHEEDSQDDWQNDDDAEHRTSGR